MLSKIIPFVGVIKILSKEFLLIMAEPYVIVCFDSKSLFSERTFRTRTNIKREPVLEKPEKGYKHERQINLKRSDRNPN